MLDRIQKFRENKSEENIRKIMSLAKIQNGHASNYLLSFTQYQLSKAENFLDNAWLVNKFPDELAMLGDAMATVKATELNEQTSYEVFSELDDVLNYRIQRLQFCITILEDERQKLSLSPVEER